MNHEGLDTDDPAQAGERQGGGAGSLAVSALRRGVNPAKRSAATVRRLLLLVSEWPTGAGVDITIGARSGGSRTRVVLDPIGPVPDVWRDDIRWELRSVARLKDVAPRVDPAPETVAELRAARESAPPLPVADDVLGDPTTLAALRREERMAPAWPAARLDDLGALLELLRGAPDLAVRFRIASAAEVEAHMVADAVRAGWPGDDGEVSEYIGRPVRVRALLGARSGRLPARLRALTRQWATELRLVEHVGEDAVRLWQGPAETLAGAAVPEQMALGLVRFPVAGEKPVAGLRSEFAAVAARPLDPVPPRPARPIRLGRARRAGGGWTPVLVDVDDLRRGGLILGATGAGKSVFLRGIARAIAQRDDVSFTFFDPHGATARLIAEETPAEAVERTRYFRFGDAEARYGVNLLDGDPADLDRRADAFADLIADKDDPRGEHVVGPRWRRTVGLVIAAVAACFGPRASLVVVAAILSDRERIRRLARAISRSHPELSHRLSREVGELDGKEATDLTSWATSKFHPLVSGEAARVLFGSRSSLDVRAEIAAGRNLIFDLDMPALGGATSTMLGTLLLTQYALAMGHVDPDRTHVIFVDELHRFGYGPIPSLAAEGRKYGLPVFGATQDIGQLRARIADGLEANAGLRCTLRTGLKAAVRASAALDDWPAGELTRLPDLTAALVMSRDGVPSEPFTLHLDHLRRLDRSGPDARHRDAVAEALAARTRESHVDAGVQRGPLSDAEVELVLDGAPRPRAEPGSAAVEWTAARRSAVRTAVRPADTACSH